MSEEMTVREIVARYLRANGFDGLYNDVGCGCDLSDLMPCDGPSDMCEPSFRTYCPNCGDDVFVPVRVRRNLDEGKPPTLRGLLGKLAVGTERIGDAGTGQV